MDKPLRALIVEDSEDDALLLKRQLGKDGYKLASLRVDSAEALISALDEQAWDVVLSDYILPGFSGVDALEILLKKRPETPFILISGKIGEETAVALLKSGANDVIMKSNVKRLAPAIERALQEATARAEKRKAEEALKQSESRLRSLSRKLVAVQETERHRIARELHDEIGQSLTVLKLLMGQAGRAPAGDMLRIIKEAETVLTGLIGQVREMSLNLRPSMLDDIGLLPTLLWHVQQFTARTGIDIDFKHAGLDKPFPPEVGTAVYRIVQEALTNIARHAGVRQAEVRCWADAHSINVSIADRGRGFDRSAPREASTGISSMQERVLTLNGEFTLKSSPGAGTQISAGLPLGAKAAHED